MFAPNERQLYVNALKPPTGYTLKQAVGTTYSVDLAMLLSLPIAFALPQLDTRRLGEESAIALLQAVRSISEKLTVFCDSSGIGAPSGSHVLYGLLEPTLYEVSAPHGGSLHAKVWFLRFEPDADTQATEPELRLVVLSRNLSFDRSWDVSARLEGRITGRTRKENAPLLELLALLPERTLRPFSPERRASFASLADEVRRAEWDLPSGFDELAFHLLGGGRRAKTWVPPSSDRLLVISPFVSDAALGAIAETTRKPAALVARAEELDRIDRKALKLFDEVFTLHEAAERDAEEGEEEPVERSELRGLHAKVYMAKQGWNTSVILGSANATSSALLAGQNIELMVELVGKTSGVPGRGIDGVLGEDGFRELLTPYDASTPLVVLDGATVKADELLRRVQQSIALAPITLSFAQEDGLYSVRLHLPKPSSLEPTTEFSAWLVTMDASTAREAYGLFESGEVSLQSCSPESATSFVAFRIMAAKASAPLTFVRNLPTSTMPADRDAHVMRLVISNQDRFFRYLLGLLDGMQRELPEPGQPSAASANRARRAAEAGLLERLIRARARHPERIASIRTVVETLSRTSEGAAVLPEEFMTVWRAIEGAQP